MYSQPISSLRAVLHAGCAVTALMTALVSAQAATPATVIESNSLIISTSTYDRTQGAIAGLAVGSTLANSATATTRAVAGNSYVTTWNNESVDASYGVTSPILLQDLDAKTGTVLHTIAVPPDQVVTSFPSKSELGLHLTKDIDGTHLTFVGYGLAGVGALDVSNSDAVPGQDPTNPVTVAFGSHYAFPRTIVSMDASGDFSYTPTNDYGGNNGRSALLASNGLYYTVGNANNGNAATFGSASNHTTPDVTETTGVEVVTPLNNASISAASQAAVSAEIDPKVQLVFGGKTDKPGKDNNFRGITEYNGALYFTKGSGSNGIDTVYTVSPLPDVAAAPAAQISVVPGFPVDSARSASGAGYTPFAVFFANPTTMYVTDEGSGGTSDATKHAGLEKWSLVNGIWQLDYVLTNGLFTTDTGLTGDDGPYPDVTTSGLRNLTGVVNKTGTVTLWATTATKSSSTDNGADPNKLVKITDILSAKTLTGPVATETFTTVAGPTYGRVYRGVVYAP